MKHTYCITIETKNNVKSIAPYLMSTFKIYWRLIQNRHGQTWIVARDEEFNVHDLIMSIKYLSDKIKGVTVIKADFRRMGHDKGGSYDYKPREGQPTQMEMMNKFCNTEY